MTRSSVVAKHRRTMAKVRRIDYRSFRFALLITDSTTVHTTPTIGHFQLHLPSDYNKISTVGSRGAGKYANILLEIQDGILVDCKPPLAQRKNHQNPLLLLRLQCPPSVSALSTPPHYPRHLHKTPIKSPALHTSSGTPQVPMGDNIHHCRGCIPDKGW